MMTARSTHRLGAQPTGGSDPFARAGYGPVELVEAAGLSAGFSPRLGGTDPAHSRQLADVVDELPPIVVQRSSMRVVDGMHRLEAARSRGERYVPVVFFDGSDEEAFVAAVQLNVRHGMPLSAEDRATAAGRILASHPEWSDRRIASLCGVAPKTVAAQRRRSMDDRQRLNIRIGRDGRRHPVSAEDGRRLATEIMRAEPGVSLREVARRAGISVGTAMDVRRRIAAQDDAADPATPPRSAAAEPPPAPPESELAIRSRLEHLIQDPSLRYTERGRALLRLASATLAFIGRSDAVAESIPGHCRESLRTVAQACASGWREFGDLLGERDLGGLLGADEPARQPARRAG